MSDKYEAVLFIDVDEYLVLHGRKIRDYLGEGAWRRRPVLGFNWVYYGSMENGREPAGFYIRRFRHRGSAANRHVKPLLNMDVCLPSKPFFCNPHVAYSELSHSAISTVAPDGLEFAGPYNEKAYDFARYPYIAHFYCRSRGEFKTKISRGRPDFPKDSRSQYFNQEESMWKQYAECDQNDVFDDEMFQSMYGDLEK